MYITHYSNSIGVLGTCFRGIYFLDPPTRGLGLSREPLALLLLCRQKSLGTQLVFGPRTRITVSYFWGLCWGPRIYGDYAIGSELQGLTGSLYSLPYSGHVWRWRGVRVLASSQLLGAGLQVLGRRMSNLVAKWGTSRTPLPCASFVNMFQLL